ncbi:MAG: replication initiation factor domain-containing protein [Thermomonas sp.]|uniref:replication initiation factor domain-containing protein n=1 Tax=Thermomonas sp. TaxID=1971895 RepID=UPI0039E2792C
MSETAAKGLPLSNRGVSESERIGTVVDWLAVSVDLLSVLESREVVGDAQELLQDLNGTLGLSVQEVAQHIADHFFPGVFALGEQRPGTFYRWRVRLENAQGNHVGLIELGGRECVVDGQPTISTYRKDGTPTARIELTGDGCRLYETSSGSDHAERWSLLASLLGCCDARITRIDIAADDFEGQYPVSWAMQRYDGGDFDKRGQKPKARFIDDMGNKTGKTLYVGSRASENQLRVYEKGREQGDMESEWVRYEGEFHASNRRELPLNMLIDGAAYLVGAYPVLDFVAGIGERLRVATEQVIANCKRAVMHFRKQYGPMLNAMLYAAQGDEETLGRLVAGTARRKLPKWCPSPDQAVQLLTVILFAPQGQQQAEKAATS